MTTNSCIWTEWRLIKVTVSVARGKKDSSVFFFSSIFFFLFYSPLFCTLICNVLDHC